MSKVLEQAPELEAHLAPMIAAGAATGGKADQLPAARALVAQYAPMLRGMPEFLRRIVAAIAQALLEELAP